MAITVADLKELHRLTTIQQQLQRISNEMTNLCEDIGSYYKDHISASNNTFGGDIIQEHWDELRKDTEVFLSHMATVEIHNLNNKL